MKQQSMVQELFARHGLRLTRQRRAIYEALSATKAHPTADQLYRDVASADEGISLATVYNTLDALCESGLARRIPGLTGPGGHNGSTRYDATVREHLHMRCEKSGLVQDVPERISEKIINCIPQDSLKEIESKLGFNIKHVQIELIGEYDAGNESN